MNLVVFLLLTLQAADPVAEGTKALEQQNFPLAIQLFSQAIEKDPQDYFSRFNLALAYTGGNQNSRAIEEYRKTLELKPRLYEAELNLGILLLENKIASDAIPFLEDAQTQKPKEYRTSYFLAEAYLEAGQFEKAEATYRIALENDPKQAPAAFGLGRTLTKQGKLDAATATFQRAAELDSRYKDALLELGPMFEEKKQLDAAVALYRQFPQSVPAQARLGALLLDQNKAEEAIAPLTFAAEKSPTPANRLALAQAQIRAKHPEQALPLLTQIIAANPKDIEPYLLRGRILRDQRNFKEAANSFYAVTKIKPDSVEAWNEFSAMLMSLEQYDQALAALDKIRELKAEGPPHFFFRAIILDKMKQLKPALAAYQRFLELSQNRYPDQEFQARQRVRIIERELSKR